MRVVVVIVDSLRRDHLAAYANTWLECANFSGLAERSVVFENVRTDRPGCASFRFELMTGLAASRLRDLAAAGALAAAEATLPGLLREKGVFTGLVSDHRRAMEVYRPACDFDFVLYQPGQGGDPMPDGPERLATPFEGGAGREPIAPQFAPDRLWLERYFRNRAALAGAFDPTEKLFDLASDAVVRLADREHWLMVVDCHGLRQPWDPPEDFARYRPENHLGKLAWLGPRAVRSDELDEGQLRFLRCAYADSCLFFDHALGGFLETVRGQDDVRLWLVSDHGVMIGDDGFVGFDESMANDAVRELVLLASGSQERDGRESGPVRPVDLHATLLALAGVESKWAVDGKIIDPLVK